MEQIIKKLEKRKKSILNKIKIKDAKVKEIDRVIFILKDLEKVESQNESEKEKIWISIQEFSDLKENSILKAKKTKEEYRITVIDKKEKTIRLNMYKEENLSFDFVKERFLIFYEERESKLNTPERLYKPITSESEIRKEVLLKSIYSGDESKVKSIIHSGNEHGTLKIIRLENGEQYTYSEIKAGFCIVL